MNWKIKVAIQWWLGYLPLGHRVNFLLQKLGRVHKPAYKAKRAIGLAKRIASLRAYVPIEGSVVAEVGTGWDAINALLFHLLGAAEIHTYDHLPHVRLSLLQTLIAVIAPKTQELSEATGVAKPLLDARLAKLKEAQGSLASLLSAAGIRYHAPADACMTGLPDRSVDIFFSMAVLEHVPEPVLSGLAKEAKRILKPDGVCFHEIGLNDHYITVDRGITKVNFLKYSDRAWDFWVNRPGIGYHNRWREKQFLELFEGFGANFLSVAGEVDPKDLEALKSFAVDPKFARFTARELAVSSTCLALRFPEGPAGAATDSREAAAASARPAG